MRRRQRWRAAAPLLVLLLICLLWEPPAGPLSRGPLPSATVTWTDDFEGHGRLLSAFLESHTPVAGARLRIVFLGTQTLVKTSQLMTCRACSGDVCHTSPEQEQQPVYVRSSNRTHRGKAFVTFWMHCHVKAHLLPDRVALLHPHHSARPLTYIPVLDTRALNQTLNSVTMCTGPLFSRSNQTYHGFNGTLANVLPEWIEYHRLIGVDFFRMYVTPSMDLETLRLLDYYVSHDVVELILWNASSPQLHSVWSNGQIAMSHDCVFRSLGDSQWVLFLDVDEFLSSEQRHQIFPLKDMLPELDNPRIGALQFQSWFYDRTCQVKSTGLLLTDAPLRLPQVENKRQKWMARPQAPIYPAIHDAGKPLARGYKKKFIDAKRRQVLVKHYTSYRPTPLCDLFHDQRQRASMKPLAVQGLRERVHRIRDGMSRFLQQSSDQGSGLDSTLE